MAPQMWLITGVSSGVGDDLYVRSVNGPDGAWYRGTQTRREGRVSADGVTKDVTFADAGHEMDGQIDEAYRTKYHRYGAGIVGSVVNPAARTATIKLVPRS